MLDRAIKKFSIFTVTLLFSVFLVSCNSDTVFNQTISIPTEGWYKNNSVSFDVNITDTLTTYNFGLIVRNKANYRYSNLYLFLVTKFPNDNISRDTIEIILADNNGKWLGKGWGDIKENQIILKSRLRFPLTGNYNFLIQQAMRVDTLVGINDIGLSLVKDKDM